MTITMVTPEARAARLACRVDGNQLCEMGHVCLDSRCQSMQEERVVRWWHLAMEVQRILSKTIDMCGEVGTQPGQDLFVHGIPFGRELMQDARLRMHIVEDQAIGDEMTIRTSGRI